MPGLSLGLGLGRTRGVAAGGGGLSLAPDAGTGPVFVDDFDRADEDPVGGDWEENSSTGYEVVSNRIRNFLVSNGAKHWLVQEGVSGGGMFIQVVRRTDAMDTRLAIEARRTAASNGDDDGYTLNVRTDSLDLFRWDGGAFNELDTVNESFDDGVDIPMELYVADGVQKGWAVAPGGEFTVSATDTTHDGATGRFAGLRDIAPSGANRSQYADGFIWTPSPFIAVSGLDTGQKAKVLNASEEVVATATESGGTATINCSRYEEAQSAGTGATELVPVAGWAALIVTDASDVELARYDSTGIFPGYAYTAS